MLKIDALPNNTARLFRTIQFDESTDEGLGSVGVKMTLDELYEFFIKAISEYQQNEASAVVMSEHQNKK